MDKTSKIHDFSSYVSREDPPPSDSPIYDLLGTCYPNSAINLNKIKEDTKRGNVKLHTYRDKIRVRYDRADALPTTRLDYDVDLTKLSHIQ